jgi:general secretion pathway protein C
MPINRISIPRIALPQTTAEWEEILMRGLAWLAKVPLSRWQFLVQVLLVFCLSFSAAHLFWLLVPSPQIPAAAFAVQAASNRAGSDGSGINIAELKGLSVFGKADAPAAKADTSAAESQAVNSNLNLMLMGVISSTNEAMARAIITANSQTDIYAVGNSLPVGNGVTLAKVMSDRAIINNNGQFESLWLYQSDSNTQPISQAYVPEPRSSDQDNMPQNNPETRPIPTDKSPNHDTPIVATNPIMDKASRSLSDVVGMSIYREGGQVVGYKIRPGRDAEKFKSLGLQTDDIVTAVNGMPLTNPSKIMEMYKNMGNTTSASLEIRRSGSVMTVDVVLQ